MHISRRNAFILLGCGGAAAAAPRLAYAQDAAAKASEALDALATQDRFSGAVLVARNGRPALRKAWGMADREAQAANTPDTRFNIASMGKMFTAVAIGQLVEQGKLDWNDRLSDHLPDFPRETASRVTIDQLLSHRAGFGAYFRSPKWEEAQYRVKSVDDFVALFRDEPLQFEPGSRFGYSNNGFVLLGAVIERLTGQDYYEAIHRRVFVPAGMKKTAWLTAADAAPDVARGYANGCMMRPNCEPGPWTAFQADHGSPAGGQFSTVDDLLAFERALRGGKLVKPETLATLLTARVAMGPPGPPPPPGGPDRPRRPAMSYAYGFGRLEVNGKPAWGHNGGAAGVGCQMDALDDGSLTFILLTNQDEAMFAGLPVLRQAFA